MIIGKTANTCMLSPTHSYDFFFIQKRQRTMMNSLVHYICIRIRYCLERDVFHQNERYEKKMYQHVSTKKLHHEMSLGIFLRLCDIASDGNGEEDRLRGLFFALTFSVRFCFPVRPNWFKNTKC